MPLRFRLAASAITYSATKLLSIAEPTFQRTPVNFLIELGPWLIAMAVLTAMSGFFSCSEAALFYLRPQDRRLLAAGGPADRAAARLLEDPDRLLSSVLFWNLVVNVAYFAIAAIAAIRLERSESAGASDAVIFSGASVMVIIFFSEMLPKSVAVLNPKGLSRLVALPLSVAVRIIDPVMPLLRAVNVGSRRLLWPGFEPEPYLSTVDLERAVELSRADAQLVEQEQSVLRNIVSMAETRIDEWMRPRRFFTSFRPPVALSDLGGEQPSSGYLLITETGSDEIARALNLNRLAHVPKENLENLARPVIYLPWCTTLADAAEAMQEEDNEVVAVVNEFGETIGILTYEDVIDTVFTPSPSRTAMLLNRKPIRQVEPGRWQALGMITIRRLGRYFQRDLPPGRSVTLAGAIGDELQRLPVGGDEVDWGPFHLIVLDAPPRGQMLVELTLTVSEEEET